MILGTISSYSSGSGVTLTIDGETSPTTKKYMFLGSYTPVVGDRVLIEEISDSYVVLGVVVSTPKIIQARRVTQYSDNPTGSNYVEFTYFNSNLWVRINGSTQFALAKG
jgi:hypothetical protein